MVVELVVVLLVVLEAPPPLLPFEPLLPPPPLLPVPPPPEPFVPVPLPLTGVIEEVGTTLSLFLEPVKPHQPVWWPTNHSHKSKKAIMAIHFAQYDAADSFFLPPFAPPDLLALLDAAELLGDLRAEAADVDFCFAFFVIMPPE